VRGGDLGDAAGGFWASWCWWRSSGSWWASPS
jgi:hypothetical protein